MNLTADDYPGCVVAAGRVVDTAMTCLVETREGVTGRIEFADRRLKPGEAETMH